MKDPLVSIIIPVFNEEKFIGDCLTSLKSQSTKDSEIIVVDDGSNDKTVKIVKDFDVTLIRQNHKGPGPARNSGAQKAKGDILVFVDADMTFEKNFIKDLILPILDGSAIGTFSKNEMVKNLDNIWSIAWNLNKNLPKDRMIPKDFPDTAHVFRAIKKKEFEKIGGFNPSGEYTDDWSIWQKLGKKSTLAPGAFYYHSNPATLIDVWRQARWIGKSSFISGSLHRKILSLILYSLPMSIVIGIIKSIVSFRFNFIVFKLVYDLAIWVSVLKSFLKEIKAK